MISLVVYNAALTQLVVDERVPLFHSLTDPIFKAKRISKCFTFCNSCETSFKLEVSGEVNAMQAFILLTLLALLLNLIFIALAD